jgi:hypothetical protein
LAVSAVTIGKCAAVHIMANRQAWLILLIQYSGATFRVLAMPQDTRH